MTVRLYTNDGQDLDEVDFEAFVFPGGEPHCEIDPEEVEAEEILIDARIASMEDLGLLLVLTDAVRRAEPCGINLFLPYVPGARQDRVQRGFAFTARVIADILNLQNYQRVFVVDPHSEVTPALIRGCEVLSAMDGLKEILVPYECEGLICPDAGAEKRVHAAAAALGIDRVFYGRKKRDWRTGSLSDFSIEALPDGGRYLVVDDICDGGGTFIGLAQAANRKLDLYVTHGIFSKGSMLLKQHFGRVISTDSFPAAPANLVGVERIDLLEALTPTLIERCR